MSDEGDVRRNCQYSTENFHAALFTKDAGGHNDIVWLQPETGQCFSVKDHSRDHLFVWIKAAWGHGEDPVKGTLGGARLYYFVRDRVIEFRKLRRNSGDLWFVVFAGLRSDWDHNSSLTSPGRRLSTSSTSSSFSTGSSTSGGSGCGGGRDGGTDANVLSVGPMSPPHKIDSEVAKGFIANIKFLLKLVDDLLFGDAFTCSVNMVRDSRSATPALFRPCLGWADSQHWSEYVAQGPGGLSAFTVEEREDDFLYSYRFALYRYQHCFIRAIGDTDLQKRVMKTQTDVEPTSINPLRCWDDAALKEASGVMDGFSPEKQDKLRLEAKHYLNYHLNEGLLEKYNAGKF
jgi:hypothetical protein